MTLEEFEDRIDRHGENLTVWPRGDRAGAEALLQQSAAARALLAEAQAWRQALKPSPIRAPAGLADRIVARATAASRAAPAMPVAAETAFPMSAVARLRAALRGLRRRSALSSVALRPEFVLAACFVAGIVVSLLPFETARERSVGIELPTLFTRSWR